MFICFLQIWCQWRCDWTWKISHGQNEPWVSVRNSSQKNLSLDDSKPTYPYSTCLRSGALCIHGEVQLFSLLLEVMMEPRSWPPQRFNKNSFAFTIWTKSVTQVLNINDGTWKCGGDMNIRRQGVRGLIFEKKKNSWRIVKEAWKRHLFGQLIWQGKAQYLAIYQSLPLGSKSSIFDQIWSIYLIWRFHFYLKYKE